MAGLGAAAHLDENERSVGRAQHEVDLPAAAPGRPIIARLQAQARRLQMGQRQVFGRLPHGPRGTAAQPHFFKEIH